MVSFAVFFRPGPRWDAGVPLVEQDGIVEHPAFLSRQFELGVLVMGGPFADGSGGLSVFEVAGRDELEALLATDVAQTSGLLVAEVHEWHASFDRSQRGQ